MLKINYLDDNRALNEDTDSAATHKLLYGFKCLSAVDYRSFTTSMSRTIDTRPYDALRAEDANWGERDDGSGGRRAGLPMSLKLTLNPGLVPQGDR